MSNPTVSVVLNVFNGQDYIGQCIDSVLRQTLKDFEFIIIDDGSTDATAAIVRSYNDRRIRFITQENSGIAESANRGIAMALAPWIARIDHDDIMLPERLATQIAAVQANPLTALVCTAAQLIINDKESTDYYTVPSSAAALRLRLLFDNPVVQSTVLIKTSAVRQLGGYIKRPLPFPEDFHLWVRMAHAWPVLPLTQALTQYRIRPGSASYGNRSSRFNVEVSANSLHLYLASEHSWAECESLAATYHRLRGNFLPISISRSLSMLEKVARLIGGPPFNWDREFKAAYAMQRRVIRFHGVFRSKGLAPIANALAPLRLRD